MGNAAAYVRTDYVRPDVNAYELLEWMTHHHLPLHLLREDDGEWAVVDASSDTVLASAASAVEALAEAERTERDALPIFQLICPQCGHENDATEVPCGLRRCESCGVVSEIPTFTAEEHQD